jgi:hypothetical protein
MELHELVSGIMTKQTVFASVNRLKVKGAINYDERLKRYRMTTKGFEDLRTGAIKRVMAGADMAYQPPLVDRTLNRALFSSLFIMMTGPEPKPTDSSLGEGYLAGEKKRQETSSKSWLYYIVKYATARRLLKKDSFNIEPQHLMNIWPKLFPRPLEIVVTEYLNSENLLHWLKTSPEATATLRNALASFPQEVLKVE